MESFWARMQVELLDRRRWRTRIEMANTIFEYPRGLPQPATTPHLPRSVNPDPVRENLLTIINSFFRFV